MPFMPDPAQPPPPPLPSGPISQISPGNVTAQPPRKKPKWPWLIGGCGCLTLIALCIAGVIFFYYYSAKQSARYTFGETEWQWKGSRISQQFDEQEKTFVMDVLDGNWVRGHYRLVGDKFYYTYTDWSRPSAYPGGLPEGIAAYLNQEQENKLTWIDANTFKLTRPVSFLPSGNGVPITWKRTTKKMRPSLWNYSPNDSPAATSSPRQQQEHEISAIAANELWQAYQDETAADKLYKGKTITVTGRIYFAGVPAYQKTVIVSLKDKEGNDRVLCNFPASAKDSVAALKEDQQVTIRGRCDGSIFHMGVQLKDCELVRK
jgi:hypothetical protein